MSIEQDFSEGRLTKTDGEIHERGFARARFANKRNGFTRFDVQIDFLQRDFATARIAKADVFKNNFATQRNRRGRLAFVTFELFGFENFAERTHGIGALRERGKDAQKLLHRADEHPEISVIHHRVADADAMMHDEPRGKDEARELKNHEGEPRTRRKKFRERVHLRSAFADALEHTAHAARLDGFESVRARDRQHLQHLADARIHLLRLDAHGFVLFLEPAIKKFQQRDARRDGDEKIQREQWLFHQRDDRDVGDDEQPIQTRVHQVTT